MLVSGSQLFGTPIMGLQTGKELARTDTAVINPGKLSVIAFRVTGQHLDHNPSYLRILDIREMGNLGMIIDSSDEFIEPDDIITEKSIYDLDFQLEGMPVVDETGSKVGKVSEYVVDMDSFVIEQLVVKRPLLKSFTDDELIIHRKQVVKITDEVIVVKSSKNKKRTETQAGHRYVNPFRQPNPQPDSSDVH